LRRRSIIRTSLRIAPVALLAAALLVPAGASAQTYPEPKQPGPLEPKPKGPHHTLTVCHKKHRCDFRSIQKAVNAAKAGDTIRVRNGVYHEAVKIKGHKKRYLRVIGNPHKPKKVVLEGKHTKNPQNAFLVDNADKVTLDGFMARNYLANGFFVVNLNGYTLNHLIAGKTGAYGLYAFNTIGGRMLNSEGYYNNDAGLYIGQTPPQDKPVQTIVRNVDGWGNPLGFSATNMRYVTITKSRFYNNAIGIVPNVLDSEKYPPAERNEIVDNDIFWNNLNFHVGHPPFAIKKDGVPALAPLGTGVLLLGGRQDRVENNRIYGNYLAGVGAIDGILAVNHPESMSLDGNIVRNNAFGLGGTDLNGHDLVYDGSGSDNCFTLAPTDTTFPEDRSTIATCSGANGFQQSARDTLISWIAEGALKGWRTPGHPPKKGYKPLESFK
jgi:hypothetical protein